MRVRTIKTGDILIVYPSKNRVKVINVTAKKINLEKSDERYYLKDYWKEKYNVMLPTTFRIVTCQFASTSNQEYDYPLYRKCVRKPFGQYRHKKMWKIDRKYFLFNRAKKTVSDILGVNQEDLSKTKKEMMDNKGNWHPPSDYTMYQMGF